MRISDWSSDVCSSDLPGTGSGRRATLPGEYQPPAVEYEEKGALAESWALLRTLCQSRYRVAIGLLAGGIVAVLVGNMVGQVQLKQWHGAFFDALEQQNLPAFGHQLLLFLAIVGGLPGIAVEIGRSPV